MVLVLFVWTRPLSGAQAGLEEVLAVLLPHPSHYGDCGLSLHLATEAIVNLSGCLHLPLHRHSGSGSWTLVVLLMLIPSLLGSN